jgi:putative endonuclease
MICPCVYIMASQKNGTIYIGVTTNLIRRVREHQNDIHLGFTQKYQCHTLVYYEVCERVYGALSREK